MQATIRFFDTDADMREFDALVLACEKGKKGYRALLDQTAFFPEGGGQTSDIGMLGGRKVSHVWEKDDGLIWHELDGPLGAGETVHGCIDWEKRFWDMQQHSGEHIVSGLMHRTYGFDNVGFRLGSDYVTMDFNGVISKEELAQIETRANEAVFADLPIYVRFPSREELAGMQYRSKKEIDGQIRIVEIPGIDICACCAPHMHTTGEIGLIRLTHMEHYKGGIRVYMICGFRALDDYREKSRNVEGISVLLSAKPEAVYEAVRRQNEEVLALRERNNLLRTQIINEHLERIPDTDGNVCFFDEQLDKMTCRRAFNQLTGRFKGLCGSFCGSDHDGYQFVLGGRSLDAGAAGKDFCTALGGKGGGSAEMFQGRTGAARAAIEDWFAMYKLQKNL